MKLAMRIVLFVLVLLTSASLSYSESIPFDSDRWTIEATQASVEQYMGRQSLFMKGGFAFLNDVEFTDGVLEFDVAFGPERGFVGAVWRMIDFENHEEFYLRPHQSGNPDANQYSPVFNRLSAWQLYHGEGFSAPVTYAFNEWIPVKIVVSGKRAEIYIQDLEQAVLHVPDLKQDAVAGKVGLRVKNFAPARFSNFRYTATEASSLPASQSDVTEGTIAGTIDSWKVSNTFAEVDLSNMINLAEADKLDLTWDNLVCEDSGLANISRLRRLDRSANCVFMRTTITAENAQTKRLDFGYSDRAKVYLNGQLVYDGTNTYRSRDYRYLGTIGYFDALYLQLEAGQNELRIAVAESFGGWGVQARFDDMAGISVGR